MRKLALFLVLFACVHTHAQRHYSGVSAIEGSYGMNIFGKNDHNASISFSKYRNRTTYWKVGLNYFEKSFTYNYEDPSEEPALWHSENRLARDYYVDVAYYKTVATNLSSLYFNLGLGLFTGVEAYKEVENEYEFLVGPKIEAELEYFVSRRFGFVARVKQYWNPFSKSDWNTVWNVGIKVLLY